MMQHASLIVGAMRLGSWGRNFTGSQYAYFIDACLDLGLNEFDHADIYGDYTTEAEFGAVVKSRPDLKSRIRITTKCGIHLPGNGTHSFKSYDSSASHIRQSVDRSLRNLGIERIDLLLIHRPDILMEYDEVADCFEALKANGKVRAIGVSNFNTFQLDRMNDKLNIEMHQQEISLTHLDAFFDGTIDWAQRHKVRISAWSPLGGGNLLDGDKNPEAISIKGLLDELTEKYECTASQLLLAWLKRHPADIIPVLGTSRVERIEEALGALDIKMERVDWYRMLEASRGHEVA